MDFVFEATGSNPNLDFVVATQPDAAVEAFFTSASGTLPMSSYISQDISRAANAITIDWTDITAHLDGSPAGPPFRHETFTMPAPALSNPLPPQVAAVMAYRRDYGSDLERGATVALPSSEEAIDEGAPATHSGVMRPRARDRGRLYFGPLNNETADGGAGGKLVAQFITDFKASFDALAQTQNSGLANQFNYVQWSRRNASVNPIRWYFLDENMGTVRRRNDTSLARVHSWIAV